MRKSQINILIGLTFFSMALLGILESIRGAVIPSIQSFYAIGYGDIGIFLFVASLGYIAANFFGGNTADHLGQKKLMFIGTLCTAIGTLGMTMAKNYFIFIVWVAVLNYGFGSISIAANTLTPVIFKNNQGIMMNLLHFFYGLGATIGPRYAGVALDYKWSWQNIYNYTLVMLAIFVVFILFIKFPEIKKAESAEKTSLKEVLANKKVLLFAFILGFYVAAELGVANWLTTYLQNAKGIDPVKSATYLSIFYGIFAFGRLIGGFIVEKLGYFRSTIGFLMTAIILFILGAMTSNTLLILISISGFFFSTIYPTVFALLLKEFDKGASAVIGVVITISSSTNMVGNAIIGKMNDLLGVTAGFSLVAVYLLLSMVLTLILKKNIKSENQI